MRGVFRDFKQPNGNRTTLVQPPAADLLPRSLQIIRRPPRAHPVLFFSHAKMTCLGSLSFSDLRSALWAALAGALMLCPGRLPALNWKTQTNEKVNWQTHPLIEVWSPKGTPHVSEMKRFASSAWAKQRQRGTWQRKCSAVLEGHNTKLELEFLQRTKVDTIIAPLPAVHNLHSCTANDPKVLRQHASNKCISTSFSSFCNLEKNL